MIERPSFTYVLGYSRTPKPPYVTYRRGNVIDRDLNASINILNECLRNISAGTVDYTDGADVIPTCRLSAMKSEAHKSLVCG